MLTIKELLESCKAVERIIEREAKAATENSVPGKSKGDRNKKDSTIGKAKEATESSTRSSTKLKPGGTATGTKEKVKSSPGNPEGPKCYNCGRTSHIAR